MDSNGRPAWVGDLLAMEQRLLARVDRLEDATHRRLDTLAEKLDSKADAADLRDLAERLRDVSREVDALKEDRARWSLPRWLGGQAVVAAVAAFIGGLVARLLRWVG